MPEESASATSIRKLIDTDDIRQLVARYSFAIDDHDFDTLARCFSQHSTYRSVDGVIAVSGREGINKYFRKRMTSLGPSNHVTHDHVITLHGDEPDRATGRVSSHAEVVVEHQPMLTCLRYDDTYTREDGEWRFADRLMSFFYYCAVDDYPAMLRSLYRKRLGGKPAAADRPEQLPGWGGVRPGDADG